MTQDVIERGSWQHAIDDQLVAFGRTSQEFATPHQAVQWLVRQVSEAARANATAATEEPKSCRAAGWHPTCFKCGNGLYEECLYTHRINGRK